MTHAIRSLTAADGERVFKIYADAQAQSNVPIGPNWNREQLQSETESGIGLWDTSARSAELTGFILYRELPDALEISMLATAIEAQRRGVMAELLAKLKSQAAPKALWLEVHEQNLPARKLYEKSGFQIVGRRPRYYSDNGAAILYNWG